MGSGALIDSRGLVLTCRHVIDEAASLQVWRRGQRSHFADPLQVSERRDLAVLSTDLTTNRTADLLLPGVISLTAPQLRVCGFPDAGVAKITPVTLSELPVASAGLVEPVELLRLTGAIRAGQSGGALIDCFGRIVGVVQAHYQNEPDTGFAIPISRAAPLITRAMAQASLAEGRWVGATFGDSDRGVMVIGVAPSSRLAKAAIGRGSTILAFNGQPVDCSQTLSENIRSSADSAELTFSSNALRQTLSTPVSPTPQWKNFDQTKIRNLGGARVVASNALLALAFGVDPETPGFLVLDSGSAEADQLGLEKGDLILCNLKDEMAVKRVEQAITGFSSNAFDVQRGAQILSREV